MDMTKIFSKTATVFIVLDDVAYKLSNASTIKMDIDYGWEGGMMKQSGYLDSSPWIEHPTYELLVTGHGEIEIIDRELSDDDILWI